MIVFSGGCFSGKTTTIEHLQYHVGGVVLGELIRDYLKDKSIDQIRKDPNEYLWLQFKVITRRVFREWRYRLTSFLYPLIMIDRSIGDCLFYYERYIDYRGLNFGNKILYRLFLWFVKISAWISFNCVYDAVLLFEPIDAVCDDEKFRPKNLNSGYELAGIKRVVDHYGPKRVYTINLNEAKDLRSIYSLLSVRGKFCVCRIDKDKKLAMGYGMSEERFLKQLNNKHQR